MKDDKAYFQMILQTKLFAGIRQEDILLLLKQIRARVKQFAPDEEIFPFGQSIHTFGQLISGAVHIVSCDAQGRRSIFYHVCQGDIFGLGFGLIGEQMPPVMVVATEPSQVMLFDIDSFLDMDMPKESVIPCMVFLRNITHIVAQRNIWLTNKARILMQRTIQDKILMFLATFSKEADGESFTIPFTRQEMADYLAVDRSALSRELSKMQAAGLLRYHKNHFQINMKKELER